MSIISIETTTKRTVWPVSVEEAKRYCRFDLDIEDEDFARWIEEATVWLEEWTGRKLINQGLRIVANINSSFGSSTIGLPHPPLFNVESVSVNGENVEPDKVFSGEMNVPGKVVVSGIASGEATVQIDYVAGYGESPEDIPQPVKSAIHAYVLALFNRNFNSDAERQLQRMTQTYRVREL